MSIQVASYRHESNGRSAHLFWHGGQKFEVLHTHADGRSNGRDSGDRDFAMIALHSWAEMVHEKKGEFTRKDEIALHDIGITI